MLCKKLLDTHLFEENEYFEKYLELITNNLTTKQQKFKTQKHHIIPRIAFQLYNWSGCEAPENKVNLLYCDHILAHYYLALAAKDLVFKYKMICAINFILGKASHLKLDIDTLKTFVLELDQYQMLYEESRRYFAEQLRGTSHETTDETKQKISKSNSGRIYINKDGVVRAVKHEVEVKLFLANGWVLGNPNSQKRDTKKGYTIVNKDGTEKYIKPEELQEFLQHGWTAGRSVAHKEATKAGTQKFYDSLTEEERIKKCATYGKLGKSCSEETRWKMSEAHKGRSASAYQKQLNSLNKKGTIHMTNGVRDIMVKPDLIPEYISRGFYRGRSKNKKLNN